MLQFLRVRSGLAVALMCGVVVLAACSHPAAPRPRGYHRLLLPEPKYQTYDAPGCPFTFEYPVYGKVLRTNLDSCFFDVDFGKYGARWHITLRDFSQEKTDNKTALSDYRKVIFKHIQKASNINQVPISTPQGTGMFFELLGDVPEPAGFYLTDSTRYAVMTSFYYNTSSKNDSLQPVTLHLLRDLKHMANSIRWR